MSKPALLPDTPLDPAELAAAEWVLLRERGLTRVQQKEFARWLQADERHARMYTKLEKTWVLLDRVPAASNPVPRQQAPLLKWIPVTLAAAAAIVFAFFIVNPARRAAVFAQSFATSTGGFAKEDLPDGSVIRLNTNSAAEVLFTATERRVRFIHGEANFAVAKDPDRPFIVRVGNVDVRAVGTAFNVRLQTELIEVLVTEGRVRVDDAIEGGSLLARRSASPAATSGAGRIALEPEPPVLAAGQRVTISQAPAVTTPKAIIAPVTPEEITRALAWQQRQLHFSDELLENVVAEFNRYNGHKLVIGDPQLALHRFGGKFPASDYDSLVRMLEANFGVMAERTEEQTVLRLRR